MAPDQIREPVLGDIIPIFLRKKREELTLHIDWYGVLVGLLAAVACVTVIGAVLGILALMVRFLGQDLTLVIVLVLIASVFVSYPVIHVKRWLYKNWEDSVYEARMDLRASKHD